MQIRKSTQICLFFRSLAVGSKSGFQLYSLNSVDTLEQIYGDARQDTCLVERLFSSSLVAVVSLAAPRKLKVCHFKKGTEICNYSYSNTILAVKLNRCGSVYKNNITSTSPFFNLSWTFCYIAELGWSSASKKACIYTI